MNLFFSCKHIRIENNDSLTYLKLYWFDLCFPLIFLLGKQLINSLVIKVLYEAWQHLQMETDSYRAALTARELTMLLCPFPAESLCKWLHSLYWALMSATITKFQSCHLKFGIRGEICNYKFAYPVGPDLSFSWSYLHSDQCQALESSCFEDDRP